MQHHSHEQLKLYSVMLNWCVPNFVQFQKLLQVALDFLFVFASFMTSYYATLEKTVKYLVEFR